MAVQFSSKLPNEKTTIFTVMSKLANEYNAINLSQGFPNFDCPTALKELVTEAMQSGQNQYAPMGGLPLLTDQIAQKNQRLYNKTLNSVTEITVTAGASQALNNAIQTFVHEGDEVIIIEPAYDLYRPVIELNKGIVVPYALKAPNFAIDWTLFEQLISDKTRMIIINTPHNPTGMTFQSSDWAALERLVKDTNIIVVSDEAYEHIIFDHQQHASILTRPNLWERTIATYSFGKTFHATGWKIGYAIAPAYLMKEFRKVHQFNTFCINTPMQYGIGKYLENPEHYDSLGAFYQQKRDYFQSLMVKTQFEPIPTAGSYYQLYSYQKLSEMTDVEFAKKLTKQFGVATIPISVFYTNPPKQHIIRFCFAKNESTLKAAVERLEKVQF